MDAEVGKSVTRVGDGSGMPTLGSALIEPIGELLSLEDELLELELELVVELLVWYVSSRSSWVGVGVSRRTSSTSLTDNTAKPCWLMLLRRLEASVKAF